MKTIRWTVLVALAMVVCAAMSVNAETNVYTANDSFIIPAGVSSVTIKAWGGGGGGGGGGASGSGGNGGGGGFAGGTFAVTAGVALDILVGVGGGGGTGADNNSDGGGGGGHSLVSNTTSSAMLLVAAGGGGGGGADNTTGRGIIGGAGGAGGGTSGLPGSNGLADTGAGGVENPYPGGGGTGSAGGAGGRNPGGSDGAPGALLGGGAGGQGASGGSASDGGGGVPGVPGGGAGGLNAQYYGGGGGGGSGYYGGGGGCGVYTPYQAGAGGGGGSSYTNESGTATSLTAGSGTAPGNTSDPDYAGSAGVGGAGGAVNNPGSPGSNGLVVIVYEFDAGPFSGLSASELTGTEAKLNATLAADGVTYDVIAYWNTVNGETNAVTWTNSAPVGSWTDVLSTNISVTASPLTEGTQYWYTFRATNLVEDWWATPLSFTTPAAPVVDNDGGVTNLSSSRATLQGRLTAGISADAWICWGDNDPATDSTGAWDTVEWMGLVNQGAVFSTNLVGLVTDQPYYYRCYVTNGVNDDWSDVISFTPTGAAGLTLSNAVTLNLAFDEDRDFINKLQGGTLQIVANGHTVTPATAPTPANVNGILPWTIIDSGSSIDWAVANGDGSALTSYTGYDTAANSAGWAAAVNARPASSLNPGNKSINSLVLDNGVALNPSGSQTLTFTASGILQPGGLGQVRNNNYQGRNVLLAFGAQEGLIHVLGTLGLEAANAGYYRDCISGSAGVTKSGSGTLILGYNGASSGLQSYANVNTGPFTINEGLVRAQSAHVNALGAGAATLILNGGRLEMASNSDLNYARNTTVRGNFALAPDRYTASSAGVTYTLGTLGIGGQTLTVSGGANVNSGTAGLTFSGATTLSASPTFNVVNPTAGGTTLLTLAGAIGDGGGGYGFTKTGNGTLALGGGNTYTGTTVVADGILSLTTNTCLPDNAAVYVASGAKLNLNYASSPANLETVGALYFDGVPQASGVTWGATGSGAANTNDTYLSGTGMLVVGELLASDPPEVDNEGGVTHLTTFNATLHGRLTAGLTAYAWICWGNEDGETVSTGNWDHVVSVGVDPVLQDAVFEITTTGTLGTTPHFYRCYVSNAVDDAWSDVVPFTALTPLPLVLNNAVTTNITIDTQLASITKNQGGTLKIVTADPASAAMLVDTAPANINGILPWAIIDDATAPGGKTINWAVANGDGNALTSLTSYNTAAGSAGWTAAVNARPASSFTVGGSTVNSIALDNSVNLSCGASATTVTLGGILQSGGLSQVRNNNYQGRNVLLAFGAQEGLIHVIGTLGLEAANSGYYRDCISGSAGITKSGSGTLILGYNGASAGLQSYGNVNTGPFTINEGVVRAQSDHVNTLGAGAATLVLNGGTLELASDSDLDYARDATINSACTLVPDRYTAASAGVTYTLGTLAIGNQTLTVEGGDNVSSGTAGLMFSGATTLSASPTFYVTNPLAGGTTVLTLAGEVGDGGGGYGFTKTGNGTMAFSGANTYTGVTVVAEGILSLTTNTCLPDNAAVYVANGAKLNLNYASSPANLETVGALYLGGVLQASGVTWGATGSGAANIDDTYFSGTGMLVAGEVAATDPPGVDNEGGVTHLTTFSATLHGRLTNGITAYAWICWGDNDGGTVSTGSWDHVVSVSVDPVLQDAIFEITTEGYLGTTPYFYRCYVTNTVDDAWSDLVPFTALTPVPLILNDAVTTNIAIDTELASITKNQGGTLKIVTDDAASAAMVVDTAPANVNGILPWAIIDDATVPGGNQVNWAVANGDGNVLTSLTSYDTAANSAGWAAAVNARPASSFTVGGSTVNSIALDNGVNVSCGAGATTVTLGGILQSGGLGQVRNNNYQGRNVLLAFGAQEGLIHVLGTLGLEGANSGYYRDCISGSAGITKSGSGTLILGYNGASAGLQSYGNVNTGPFTINEGLVRAQSDHVNTLGAGAATLVLNGGTLELASDSDLDYARDATINSACTLVPDRYTAASAGVTYTLGALAISNQTLTVEGGANVSSGTAGLTFSGATTLSSSPTFYVTNPVAGGTTVLTLAGAVGDGGGGYGFTKTGNGTLALSGANTFTGDVTVEAGVLSILGDATTTAIDDDATLNIADGAKVELADGVEEAVGELYLDGALAPAGTWGGTGSGATHIDPDFFAGTGVLNALSGLPAGTLFLVR